jgi:hypothetical protein
LYGYIDMNTINKGKRDEVINKFDWKYICKQKGNKKGRGVEIPCHECMCHHKHLIHFWCYKIQWEFRHTAGNIFFIDSESYRITIKSALSNDKSISLKILKILIAI